MKLKRVFWTLLLISVVSLSSLCSAAALKYGDRGDDVKEIQDYLIAQNLLHVSADGVYGSATVEAIKDFQTALGLEVDGVCGEQTYKILRAAAYDEIDITTFRVGDYIPEHDGYVPENYSEDSSDDSVSALPDYSRVIRVEATAYSSAQPGLNAYTALGTLCTKGVIAVDPNIIPLGTKVYIPGYGYAVAEDTGGAIYGHKIDVAFDTLAECYEFGRKLIDVYILD